jgi:molybdopterin synthase sulfur carrier subunit
MRITIHYFAALAEAANCTSESLEIETPSAEQLFVNLKDKYHWPTSQKHCSIAINDAFASWQKPLQDGDHVVFMTPFAGG